MMVNKWGCSFISATGWITTIDLLSSQTCGKWKWRINGFISTFLVRFKTSWNVFLHIIALIIAESTCYKILFSAPLRFDPAKDRSMPLFCWLPPLPACLPASPCHPSTVPPPSASTSSLLLLLLSTDADDGKYRCCCRCCSIAISAEKWKYSQELRGFFLQQARRKNLRFQRPIWLPDHVHPSTSDGTRDYYFTGRQQRPGLCGGARP